MLRTRALVFAAVMSLSAAAAIAAVEGLPVNDQSGYDALLDAVAAAEIVRAEHAVDPDGRLAAALAALHAFVDANPLATADQIAEFATRVDAQLAGYDPDDPDLNTPARLLAAVRYGTTLTPTGALVGTDTRVGAAAIEALGLGVAAGARDARSADFDSARSVDLSNHTPFADLVVAAWFDRTPAGSEADGLGDAARSLLTARGIDPAPANLAAAYPELASALAAAPADFATFDADRQAGYPTARAAIDAEFSTLQARADASLLEIADALARKPDLFEAAEDAADPAVTDAISADIAADRAARVASRASLSLNALLMAQSQDAAQRQFASYSDDIADAQLQIESGLSNASSALEVGGHLLNAAQLYVTQNPLAAAGTALFAIGGALGIVDANTGGPTPEQQIFDQIVALREQVEELRMEMNARFDSIDRQLGLIYEAMVTGLNQLNEATREIDTNVRQLTVDLHTLRSELAALEANLYGVVSAGFEQTFIEDMETALGFRARTGVDLDYSGGGANTFTSFESRFFARSTSIAQDEVFAGPSGLTLANNGTAAADLTGFPLGYNINNLRQFPPQVGESVWSFGRVANPTTWSLSADAYAQLARENPWYFALVENNSSGAGQSRLDEIIGAGQNVRNMMRGARNRPLIEALLGDYLNRKDTLAAQIELGSVLSDRGYPETLDPWGGLSQPIDGVGPAFATIRGSAGQTYTTWFDPTLPWELFDSRVGLAAAANLPGWTASRWRTNYRNTITEMSFPDPTHIIYLALVDLQGSAFVNYYVEYEFVGPEPSDFRDWMFERGDVMEFLFRAQADGETYTAPDGITVRFRAGYIEQNDLDDLPIPNDNDLLTRLSEIQDEYWTETNNRMQESSTLELFDALDASQQLLYAYVSIGMPETLEQNDLVRAALRGGASALSGLGGEWLKDVFEQGVISGAKPPLFDADLERRAALLIEQLGPSLDKSEDEAHAYLEWTLASLEELDATYARLCRDDTYLYTPGQQLTVPAGAGVLANDAEQPGASSIVAAAIFPTSNGSLSLSTDGSFTYQPNPGFDGVDTFLYTATANLAEPGSPPLLVTAQTATVILRVGLGITECVADINTKNVNPGEPGYGEPDGEVDGADLSFYVENWLLSNASVADINTKNVNPGEPGYGEPDGEVDGADLSFYVENWLAGCN